VTKFIDIARKHIGPPVAVDKIIEEMDIELELDAFLDDEISGELERKKDGKFRISANATHSERRKRFTIAHELGHYMLHAHLVGDGVDDNRAYRSEPNGNFHNRAIRRRHETEANRFAAQLLMPHRMIRKRAETGVSIKELADKFKVSKDAMTIRLETLNIKHDGTKVL